MSNGDGRLDDVKDSQYRLWADASNVMVRAGESTTRPTMPELVGINVKARGMVVQGYFLPPIVGVANAFYPPKVYDEYCLSTVRNTIKPDFRPHEHGNINCITLASSFTFKWEIFEAAIHFDGRVVCWERARNVYEAVSFFIGDGDPCSVFVGECEIKVIIATADIPLSAPDYDYIVPAKMPLEFAGYHAGVAVRNMRCKSCLTTADYGFSSAELFVNPVRWQS